MSEGRTPFLVGYDYGNGGLWCFVSARSEAEITARYPELLVVHERPRWMSQADYDRLLTEQQDIDGEPEGVLAAVVKTRARG